MQYLSKTQNGEYGNNGKKHTEREAKRHLVNQLIL